MRTIQILGRMSAAELAAGRYMRGPDGHQGGTLDLKAIEEHFDRYHSEAKGLIEEAKSLGTLNKARLDEIEQKLARKGYSGGREAPPRTLGAQFIEQDGVKDFTDRRARHDRFSFETKATLTSATTDSAGSVGDALVPYRDPTITPLPQRRTVVRDLLNVVPITGNSVEVVKQTGRTSGAAPVAEGAVKPSSDFKFDLESLPTRTIAHWMKASRQILEDLPQLKSLIDTELLNGLALAEEDQVLNGDGTGQNLLGLIPEATAYSAPITIVDDNGELDQIGLAILQGALALFPPTGIIMNDADWTRIALLKDGDGNYILGSPAAMTAKRLWGLPVVTTPAMTVDKFLVGDFATAATLYDRWTARVEVGTVEDDFIRNLVTVLAEERVALAVKQPGALIFGDFGNVP